MTLRRTWPIDKGLPNAVDLRNMNRWQWPIAGVIPEDVDYNPATTRNLLSAGGGWTINIAAFEAVAKRPAATDGAAFIANDALAGNVATITATAPTSGTRIDVVYVWAPDPTKGDALTTVSGESQPRAVPVFGVLVGTSANGGTSGTKPSLAAYGPSGAVELGTVSVPSTATSLTSSGVVITTTAQYATPVGAPRLFRTLADRDAATGYNGLLARVGAVIYRHDGTGWRTWQVGPTTVNLTSGSGGVNLGTLGSSTFLVEVSDGICRVDIRLRAAGSGVAWGNVRYALPYPPLSPFDVNVASGNGVGAWNDADAGMYGCWIGIDSSNLIVYRTGADNGAIATWTSSQPFTIAANDTFQGFIEYPVA